MWVGPRKITLSVRRLRLPADLARPIDLVEGRWAKLSVQATHPLELLVEPAPTPRRTRPVRDSDRARLINHHGQVTLPAEMMVTVGIDESRPLVYLAVSDDGRGIRVVPERHVSVVVAGSDR